jgi:NAD-dependent DNA ligase
LLPSAPRRAQAGAVNTLWVVILMVALLAMVGLWYATSSGVGNLEVDLKSARDKNAELEARVQEQAKEITELAALVGYHDASSVGARPDLTVLQGDLDAVKGELKEGLGGPDTKVTLQQTIASLRSALAASQAAAMQSKSDFDAEVAKRTAAETATDTAMTSMRAELDQLNQQLADERQRADNQAQQDQRRFDELVSAQQASDESARAAQQALAQADVKSRHEISALEGRIKAMAVRREGSEPDAVDGSVLSVGNTGAVAYIDIGARSGLRRGTRFEVLRPGKSGDLTPKGTVEVRDVEDDMSLVGLTTEPNAFDPILPGDKLRNPHFEANKSLRFYLLGDFPLTMSKEQATARLKELGASVDETLSADTDVLVLGEKSLAEGEGAPELTDSDEYKLADKLGIRIIRLAELQDFLKY